jgi:UDP-N-acetylglucosamine 2-epimerase
VSEHPDTCSFFPSLGHLRYLNLLRVASVVVGNSSSGITEASALNVPTVNTDMRQLGKVRGQTVLDLPEQTEAIWTAVETSLRLGVPPTVGSADRPYGSGRASASIVLVLKSNDLEALRIKHFHDLDFEPDAYEECRTRTSYD